MKIVNILVALGPALASAICVFAIEIAPTLLKIRDSILKRKRVADRIHEYLQLAAAGASGIGTILGIGSETYKSLFLGLVASAAIAFLDIAIANRRDVLERQESNKKVRLPFRQKLNERTSAASKHKT